MNIRSLAVILCSLLVLNGCGTSDPSKTLVKNYIAETEGVDAGSIKILDMEEAAPWLASDSLKILTELLQREKEEIVDHLNAAIEASKKAIEQAEKVTTSGFPALAEVAQATIDQSRETIELAQSKLELMEKNLTGTALEALDNRIDKLRSMQDNLLFQLLKGKWAGEDGEEHDFHLMADQDLSKIIGKFGN